MKNSKRLDLPAFLRIMKSYFGAGYNNPDFVRLLFSNAALIDDESLFPENSLLDKIMRGERGLSGRNRATINANISMKGFRSFIRAAALTEDALENFRNDLTYAIKNDYGILHSEALLSDDVAELAMNVFRYTVNLPKEQRESKSAPPPNQIYGKHKLALRKRTDEFFGRESELTDMESILKEHGVLFLCGMGGIGKSELVMQYISKHRQEYDSIVRVFYRGDKESGSSRGGAADEQGNLASSLMDDIDISNFDRSAYGSEVKDQFKHYYDRLQEICRNSKVLIFIDNYNTDDDPYITDIFNLDCTLIVASRHDYRKRHEHFTLMVDEIKSTDELKKLFYYNGPLQYKNALLEGCAVDSEVDNQVEDLIYTVWKHTLTIELLAKQLRVAKSITLPEMIERLKSDGVAAGNKIGVWHGRDDVKDKKETVYGHIRTIFNFPELYGGRRAHLGIMTYIPPSGIERMEFLGRCWHDLSDGYAENCLNSLIDGGWVQEDEIEGKVSLHPVISEVIWREMKPGFDDNRTLVPDYAASLLKELKDKQRSDREKRNNVEGAVFFAERIWEMTEKAAITLHAISDYLVRQGYYNDSLLNGNRALEIYQKLPDHFLDKMNCSICIGKSYIGLAQPVNAFKFMMVAVRVYMKQAQLPDICSEKVEFYNTTAEAQIQTGRYDGALEDGKLAYEVLSKFPTIQENSNPSAMSERDLNMILDYHGLLADNCDILGIAYGKLGQLEKAIEKASMAVELRQSMVYHNHPEDALNGNDLTEEEKEVLLRDVEHRRLLGMKFSNSDYTELAASSQNLSSIYADFNQYEKALEYGNKALQIRKLSLPDDHPDLISSYIHIGTICHNTGDYDSAITHFQAAEPLLLKWGNEDKLKDLYTRMGEIYGIQGKTPEAEKIIDAIKSMESTPT